MITTWTSVLLASTLMAPTQAPANDLVVSVLLRVSSPTGQQSAGSDRGDEVIVRLATDAGLCGTGTGTFSLTREHDLSWEASARIIGRTSDAITVEATWRQLEGPAATLPARSQVLVLHDGERVVLENVRGAATSRCSGPREGRLEVEAGTRPRLAGGGGSGRLGGVGVSGGVSGGGAGGLGTGGVGAAGGATGGASRGGSGGLAAGGRGGTGGTGGGRGFASGVPAAGDARLAHGVPFSVEVWLVHTLPDGTERGEGHARSERADEFEKVFDPVSIASDLGQIDVVVSLELRSLARSANPMLVVLDRRVTGALKGQGGTTRVGDFPQPNEIVSLELPRFYEAAPNVVRDVFSVRLKIERVK